MLPFYFEKKVYFMKDLYRLSSYQFHLPEELIAQYPVTPRDSSRLMIVDRQSGLIREVVFRELSELLNRGDSLVFNDTKVIPARLKGKRESGGEAEIFLTSQMTHDTWIVMAKPGRKLHVGAKVIFGADFFCVVKEVLDDGRRVVQFYFQGVFEDMLQKYGEIPLPHYIKRSSQEASDKERYQTIYAKNPGALAAPTAGLHFTPDLLSSLKAKGVDQVHITLHVGLGTFKPVQVDDIRDHVMHHEQVVITPSAAEKLNSKVLNNKRICIGTTCCRSLESASDAEGVIKSGSFATNIFIYPGYQFKYVDHMLTNFHLPGSTLLMMVSAFAGYELIMEAYERAIKERYRFFSYGDAMLIL